ncbi:choice-of-anchor M domain-containing protein [Brevibacterium album]|uniref:choice-of-anchor M domain-containing protein n=1 Tax=Brevibacterium album TaxID=417948 RepID=UPI00041CE87C|nr:choice-of-anchor M domain-containing protein [Brevibacterium album]
MTSPALRSLHAAEARQRMLPGRRWTRIASAGAALLLTAGTVTGGPGALLTSDAAGPGAPWGPPPAAAGTLDDPALDQDVDAGEELGSGQTVIDAGHVDIGPFGESGDDMQLAGRDDTLAPPVWRTLEDLVLHVPDEGGRIPVPDDPMYEFLGAEPGEAVWLIPQVEEPGVPWLGWNTQYPGFAGASDSGIDLTFHGVDGPGDFTLYLQDGAFGDPDVYWQSTQEGEQSIWVEPLTHTHANWVFTEPGIYLFDLGFSAEGADGSVIEDRQTLRIAVGTETDPQEAFGQDYRAPESGDGGGDAAEQGGGVEEGADPAAEASDSSPLMYVLYGAIGVLVLALIVGAVFALSSSRRAKARAERELAGASGAGSGSGRGTGSRGSAGPSAETGGKGS